MADFELHLKQLLVPLILNSDYIEMEFQIKDRVVVSYTVYIKQECGSKPLLRDELWRIVKESEKYLEGSPKIKFGRWGCTLKKGLLKQLKLLQIFNWEGDSQD